MTNVQNESLVEETIIHTVYITDYQATIKMMHPKCVFIDRKTCPKYAVEWKKGKVRNTCPMLCFINPFCMNFNKYIYIYHIYIYSNLNPNSENAESLTTRPPGKSIL